MQKKNQKVSVTKSELAFFNALIEFAIEEKQGPQKVTIYMDSQRTSIWTKAFIVAGKWAWKNRYKLLAMAEAVADLVTAAIGNDAKLIAELSETKELDKSLKKNKELSLDELLELRDKMREFSLAQSKKVKTTTGKKK